MELRPGFFYKLIYEPSSYCNFPEKKERNKILFHFILLYPPTLNIICFVEKNNIFLGSVCVF